MELYYPGIYCAVYDFICPIANDHDLEHQNDFSLEASRLFPGMIARCGGNATPLDSS